MKKTSLKKLHLHQNTIRQLSGPQLDAVNGGISGERCETYSEFCQPSLQNTACQVCLTEWGCTFPPVCGTN